MQVNRAALATRRLPPNRVPSAAVFPSQSRPSPAGNHPCIVSIDPCQQAAYQRNQSAERREGVLGLCGRVRGGRAPIER
jgi:hypothetical protein